MLTSVAAINRNDWALIDSFTSENGLERRKVYQYQAGDVESPAQLQVAIYIKPTKVGKIGTVTMTAKLMTRLHKVDDTTGEILVDEPCHASITTVMPGAGAVPEVSDYFALVSNAFSILYTAVDGTNVANTTVLDQWKYNIPTIS